VRILWIACLVCTLASGQTAGQTSGNRTVDIGLQDAPLSPEDRTAIAKAFSAHDYKAESAVLMKALTANPESRDLWVIAGRIAFLERHPADAADAMQKADALQALGANDRTTLALAYEALGKPEESRAELLKLTEAAPKNAEYLYLLARVDRQNNDPMGAMTNYRAALDLDPNLMRAWEELAQLQESRGNTADAGRSYEMAVERNRQQKVRWEWPPLDLGVFVFKTGETDAAVKLFRESIEINPRFPVAHFYLAQALEKQGKDKEAIIEFQFAIVHNPRYREAWLAIADLYTRLGMNNEAEQARTSASKLLQPGSTR
jgi:tetratricopeptide (TPR) repeat protein